MTRRTRALIAVWTLPSAILLLAAALTYRTFRIPPPDRLDAAARAAAIAPLRAIVDDPRATPAPCAVRAPLDPALRTVAVTVWSGGRAALRVDGTGADVGRAIDDAAARLARTPALAALSPAARAEARIQVDVVAGVAPIAASAPIADAASLPGLGDLLAVDPGIDGLGAYPVDPDHPTLLLPHELVAGRLLAARHPSPELPELALGLDLDRIRDLLASRAGAPRRPSEPPRAFAVFRFRTDAFVEAPRADPIAAPLALTRGVPPPPPLTGATLRAAALDGGRYLLSHLGPTGRFVYEHDLATGGTTPDGGAYSLPRHAGTTYFLAELFRITRAPWLKEPIERAIAHLAMLVELGRCGGALPDGTPFACVVDRGEVIAHLGSTALAVVALAEYQRATGDARYLPLATRLAAFVRFMQRPDGSFRHLYDAADHRADDATQLLYYSGEATLALARMAEVSALARDADAERRYAEAATRGLAWLVGWYDFFLGGFFYGEEHWTCIAAEALWPRARDPRDLAFCEGYGAFLRAQQPEVGDHPDQDDLAGAYNVTPFVAPYNTPAGSRTEAMISTYVLGVHHGTPDPALRAQIRAALAYVLGQQLAPDRDFAAVGPVRGGVPGSPIDRTVRIDYVQHVCSAMIRASEWIDDAPP